METDSKWTIGDAMSYSEHSFFFFYFIYRVFLLAFRASYLDQVSFPESDVFIVKAEITRPTSAPGYDNVTW